MDVLTLTISLPTKLNTFASTLLPNVPVLSNIKVSPTEYLSPALRTLKPSILPLRIESTITFWFTISFDSIIKSLSAYVSLTLYGRVFLISDDPLKSKDWFKVLFSEIKLFLNLLPIKYGNIGKSWLDPVVMPAKYAYVPNGNSGVLQNLPFE